ncbi:gamma-glutamyl-gamma-aminobutyrate hydrolase family protein [bacterium]|nr:gamma-glutamyl-gamma-aminobutyrate hydrolase family protein [bacterium]
MKFVLIPISVGVPDIITSQMHIIRRTYFTKLTNNGLTPLLVSTLHSKEEIDYFYRLASGLLLMGGTDINPKLYGQKQHRKTKVIKQSLGILEFKLAKRAVKDKKPILGICRGCQMINVALGGTLIQHVPDKYNENHEVENYEHLGEVKTKVTVIKNSRLCNLTTLSKTVVNCGHHQSVDKLGTGLRVSALSQEGVVEAIEGAGESFVMGIQSHIETQNSKFSNNIFKAFAKAAI